MRESKREPLEPRRVLSYSTIFAPRMASINKYDITEDPSAHGFSSSIYPSLLRTNLPICPLISVSRIFPPFSLSLSLPVCLSLSLHSFLSFSIHPYIHSSVFFYFFSVYFNFSPSLSLVNCIGGRSFSRVAGGSDKSPRGTGQSI